MYLADGILGFTARPTCLCNELEDRNQEINLEWPKHRSSEWRDQVAMRFTREEWKENFRVSPETFTYCCNELKFVLSRRDTQLRRALSMEKCVAIALWHLSTNADYHTIGHLFGVAKGTACIVANEVCCALVDKLFRKYVKIPSGRHLDEVVKGFETKGPFT